MQRFCRSLLLCIWCCALLVVFSYVLFDLLDIDGSDFDHSPGSGMVAQERLAGEEGRAVPLEASAPALVPGHNPWALLQSVATSMVTRSHPGRTPGRPRGALAPSPSPPSDPVAP